ncbi:hypothetical protein C8Q77DRAFT_826167 [Trametes polyzona]|nr:hypothetical protein C8Q77DRAFT_826167 [Trametes polyzona]
MDDRLITYGGVNGKAHRPTRRPGDSMRSSAGYVNQATERWGGKSKRGRLWIREAFGRRHRSSVRRCPLCQFNGPWPPGHGCSCAEGHWAHAVVGMGLNITRQRMGVLAKVEVGWGRCRKGAYPEPSSSTLPRRAPVLKHYLSLVYKESITTRIPILLCTKVTYSVDSAQRRRLDRRCSSVQSAISLLRIPYSNKENEYRATVT